MPCRYAGGDAARGHAGHAQMPGFRGADHLGITVPDIEQAIAFFRDVIGCQVFFRNGPFKFDNAWMKERLNVHPRATIAQIRMLFLARRDCAPC